MANYFTLWDTDCCSCGETIAKGDDMWFCDDGKLCESCADEAEVICPECGGQKAPDYETCSSCYQSERED